MAKKLSKKSLAELKGVHPDLVKIVHRAIQITEQDFSVHDGLRTKKEQLKLIESGASIVTDSRHLTGHAVDLVPYVNGKLRWEWPLCYKICEAVRQAAKELKIPLIWGGAWDIVINSTSETPEELVIDYSERRRAAGKKHVFLDGPHYELPRSIYPDK